LKPSQLLTAAFNHSPTDGQKSVFKLLEEFLENSDRSKKVFLLKGYAGTGKTSIVGALTKVLPMMNLKFVLLAPTGRAAKVIANYTGQKAFTIHKHIYMREGEEELGGDLRFVMRTNLATKTIFVVDEASMIGNETGVGERGLLEDLIDFVFTKKSNKILLIGDTAQLPPVRVADSPALDGKDLVERYELDLMEIELTEVVRQAEKSGILENATAIREVIRQGTDSIKLNLKGYRDFYRMGSDRLEDGLNYAYSKFGVKNTMIITRSNKTAVQYNHFIRSRIQYAEEEIQVGDMLVVVRNNYIVLPEDVSGGFLANGDFVEIVKIRNTEEQHGFRFANVILKLIDEPGEPEFDAKILLDLLSSFTPNMSSEDNQKLYQAVLADYMEIRNKRERNTAVRKDKYLNAIQVKYAYALTCHKSQGGQWDAVFIDQGYLTDDQMGKEYFRWLYTAITRGIKEVYLVNFSSVFF
jgi:exodeoxyribonuclease-5